MMKLDGLTNFYNNHKGGINGALVGFVISVSILIFGFFRILFISLFVGAGYYIGKKIYQDKDYIKNLLDRILPPGTYR